MSRKRFDPRTTRLHAGRLLTRAMPAFILCRWVCSAGQPYGSNCREVLRDGEIEVACAW